ncbi:hypothetical protein GCM10007939_02170 [Amylibacter marinus]|uniref:DUF1523 domain-containing protein n=2 Tax=Amylibacter marinus TaxID=1475483 RepID=A0ABQ5VS14_9RHOB|nr:hypothetical protein GCM10007939_02170 [Amylibacter marinus]
MRILKRVFTGVVLIIAVGILHYTLPARDIVKIVGTDVKRMDVGQYAWFWASPDSGTNANLTRDVRFVNAIWPDGSARVYRNEDTEWNWPPYFKFDSGNLTAQAQGIAKEDDIWVAVTHYGWRIKLLSIFPNAVAMKQVSGPDQLLIPWFNIVFFGLLAGVLFVTWRMLRRFKRRRIDPITQQIEGASDTVSDYANAARDDLEKRQNAVMRSWRRWFGTAKK